jgi:hypothetical protein
VTKMKYIDPIVKGLNEGRTPIELDDKGRAAIGPLLGAVVGGVISLEASQWGVYDCLSNYLGITDIPTQYLVEGGCSTALFMGFMLAGYLARNKIGEFLDPYPQQPLLK